MKQFERKPETHILLLAFIKIEKLKTKFDSLNIRNISITHQKELFNLPSQIKMQTYRQYRCIKRINHIVCTSVNGKVLKFKSEKNGQSHGMPRIELDIF